MISDSKKFIFVHVPKTGGNSIQEQLKKYSYDKITSNESTQDGLERFNILSKYSKNIKKHTTIYGYKKYLPNDVYNNYKKIAVVRNPWDRIVSLYFSPHAGRTKFDQNEFIKVIKSCHTLPFYLNLISPVEHLFSKLGFFKGIKYDLCDQIDYFLRFENLNSDYEKLCNEIGIDYIPLVVRNKSKRLPYQDYYTPKTMDLVKRKFKCEIDTFGYEF